MADLVELRKSELELLALAAKGAPRAELRARLSRLAPLRRGLDRLILPRRPLALAAALLCGSAAVGFLAVRADPELAAALTLAPAEPTGPVGLAVAFHAYVRHNVAVALAALALGFTFGLGTAALLVQNGLVVGATVALAGRGFLGFLLPHAPWELSAMCLSGAAGFVVAEALVRPSPAGRVHSLVPALLRGIRLCALSALLLTVAGLVEGLVSSQPMAPLAKVGGGLAGALVLALALGRLRG